MRDLLGPVLATAIAFVGFSAFAVAGGAPRLQVLAAVPPGEKAKDPGLSADFRHVAYLVIKSKTDKRAVVDGKPGAAFDFIGGVTFSADGSRWGHAGIRGSTQRFVIDGKEQPAFDRVGTDIVFSRDGRHFSYYAKKSSDVFVVTDGKRGPAFDEIRGSGGDGQGDLTASADGSRVAYVARKGKSWFTVIDGVPGEPYDEVSQRTGFSRDGRHAVSLGRRGTKRWLILDGQASEIPSYDIAAWPIISLDGRHVAFFAKKDGRRFLVVDGKESAAVDGGALPIEFAPGDQRLIYETSENNGHRVYDGDRVSDAYEYINYPIVSPDGRALAYAIDVRGWSYPVVNGRRGAPFDFRDVGAFAFSPDGAHLAFIGRRYGRWFLVVDQSETPLPGEPAGRAPETVFFNAQGDEAAVAVRQGSAFVRVSVAVPRS
jgi:hypothetical protein